MRATTGLRTAVVVALAAFAAGCRPFDGPLPGNPEPSPYFIQHFESEGRFPVTVDLGTTSSDVYLTFVNPTRHDIPDTLTVTGRAAAPDAGRDALAARIGSSPRRTGRALTPEAISAYNQRPFGGRPRAAPSLRLLERPTAPLLDQEGDIGAVFYNYPYLTPIDATCRKVVADIAVAGGGQRTLNIWVEDACWNGSKSTRVTQTMVDALAGKFLATGLSNDIYDWVTGMLGAEWGPTGSPELIPVSDEITILLCDIEEDNSKDRGVIGLFWSKDNYTTEVEPLSSERIMFMVDAVMYANGDGSWDPTDAWPEETYATLAHEFQHMIHFYQRGVRREALSAGDRWINEMASLVVEDLLADKLGIPGPRGVDGVDGSAGSAGNGDGWLPLFNARNYLSLADWNNDDENYAIAYAFGAWLARNYGGAMLLNRLMQCTSTGTASIEGVVAQDTRRTERFCRLLQRWSAAQLLSDRTDAPAGYRYNVGGFFDSVVNGSTYRLGSINLFSYAPVPSRYSGSGTVGASVHLSTSAALYEGAMSGTGVLEWTLDMPDGMLATVVVK